MKISILVMAYNQEKYICKALKSILMQQDCQEYELILCDDNSTDSTVSLASKLLDGIQNAFIYKNENNLGITKNYQQAFARCNGEYIFILEGDDYWIDVLKVKKQTDFLDQHPMCVMCAHPFVIQHGDDNTFTAPQQNNLTGFIYFDGKDLILDEGIISNFSTCCYRKEIIEKITEKIYDEISYEWIINICVAEYGLLARINEPMSVYRHSANGIWTQKPIKDRLTDGYETIKNYDRVLENRYTSYFNKKQDMITKQLENLETIHKSSFRSYIPPIISLIYKWVMPSVFRK